MGSYNMNPLILLFCKKKKKLTSFIQHNYLRDLTMFSCVSVVDSFLLTSGIPLHGCTTVGFIH